MRPPGEAYRSRHYRQLVRVTETTARQSPSSWRSQLCQAFAEPTGYRRSQEDTKKIHFESRRKLADTIGHGGTRHDAGSGP